MVGSAARGSIMTELAAGGLRESISCLQAKVHEIQIPQKISKTVQGHDSDGPDCVNISIKRARRWRKMPTGSLNKAINLRRLSLSSSHNFFIDFANDEHKRGKNVSQVH